MSTATDVQPGFVALKSTDTAGQVGCLFLLGVPLLLLGGGLIAVFVIDPSGTGDVWVMPLVGGGFALVGAALLYGGVRGVRGASIAPAQVFMEQGVALRPGAVVRLRLCQPGPMNIESLTLKARCERVYQRQVKQSSSATVEDQEPIWEQLLLDVRNERVPAGAVLERDATLTLPPDARPTGAAQPDGHTRWQLEVFGEAGFMRGTHRAFGIHVGAAPGVQEPAAGAGGAAAPAASPAPPANDWSTLFPSKKAEGAQASAMPAGAQDSIASATPHRSAGRTQTAAAKGLAAVSPEAGCLVIGVGFLFGGAFFLYMFFSGAAFSGKGNPYMALFGGLLFGGIGLAGTVMGVLSLFPRKRVRRRR